MKVRGLASEGDSIFKGTQVPSFDPEPAAWRPSIPPVGDASLEGLYLNWYLSDITTTEPYTLGRAFLVRAAMHYASNTTPSLLCLRPSFVESLNDAEALENRPFAKQVD